MWTRVGLCVLTLLGATGAAPSWSREPAAVVDATGRGAFDQWMRGGEPLLVLLVFEGMRGDALSRTRRTGEPLMPRLNELAAGSLVYTDCFTGAPASAAGAFELLSGRPAVEFLGRTEDDEPQPDGIARLVAAGFSTTTVVGPAPLRHDRTLKAALPWAFGEDALEASARGPGEIAPGTAAVDSLLGLAARDPSARLVVFFSDVLVPPYDLADAHLDQADPCPWRGLQESRDLRENRRERRAQARTASQRLQSRSLTRILSDPAPFGWAIDAAHVRADAVIGHVWDTIVASGLAPRASVLVTSTLGTAAGDRGRIGAGTGVHRGHVHVPLVWRLPPALEVRAVVRGPVQLMDVAATLAGPLGITPLPGADLLGELPAHRTRFSFAWYRSSQGEPRGEVRMTTTRWTLLVSGRDPARLFDLDLDPLEYEDLGPWETGLRRSLVERLDEELFGSEPELRILIKGRPGRDELGVLGGRVTLSAPPERVWGDGLEPMDVVETVRGETVPFSLLTDERGDVIRIGLAPGAPQVGLKLDTPGAERNWPVRIGLNAWPLDGEGDALRPYTLPLLRARVSDAGIDMIQWGEERSPGIYVWLVEGGESGSRTDADP